ncbi:MAG: dynamin family protein [Gammaproteobacteria bacterium]|nr:dynamin family protein [Gammaproteobacteria bacterium]
MFRKQVLAWSEMDEQQLQHRLGAYHRWKTALTRTVEGYQVWLEEHGLGNADTDRRLRDAIDTLRADKLTIAFVAEFSRGKTELINAIFFAEHGRRLLPSDAGSTTKCPTELFYDDIKQSAYLRLLPIETRATDESLRALKQEPSQWVTFPLDPEDPEQMLTTLAEVVRTKRLSLADAQKLGFYADVRVNAPNTLVEIPHWRHALISYPHPLLKQGLNLLDTPGLNALGSEPELTLHTLAVAQVVLFVLAADTGVTRSDLEMWKEHVLPGREGQGKALAVALNKIDTLWDDLKDRDQVEKVIERQRNEVAETLGIPVAHVFPVSAQKALLAKVRRDFALARDARLSDLEAFLSDEILRDRQRILRESVRRDIGQMIDNSREVVEHQYRTDSAQLAELREAGARNTGVLQQLHQRIEQDRTFYLAALQAYQQIQVPLGADMRTLLDLLDMQALDHALDLSRGDLSGRWTTPGLVRGMGQCLTELRGLMRRVEEAVGRANDALVKAYQGLHKQPILPRLAAPQLDIGAHRSELLRLAERGEAYRKSARTAMTEQSVVVKRFFESLIGEMRHVLGQLRDEVEAWEEYRLEPVASELRRQRATLSQRVNTFKKLGHTRSNVRGRMDELRAAVSSGETQIATLGRMRELLDQHSPFEVVHSQEGGRVPDAPSSIQLGGKGANAEA